MKKRKIMFAAVIVVFCLVIFVVTRQQTSRSILGTMKMYSVFQMPDVSLAQGNYSGKKLKNLSFQDKVQLFHILQKTRIYQKEKWIIRQNLRTKLYEWMYLFLYFPNLTFRSSAVRWRIHDNPIILVASSYLSFHKLNTVIHKPAYRCI